MLDRYLLRHGRRQIRPRLEETRQTEFYTRLKSGENEWVTGVS